MRKAFTLIELLVIIAIMGLMVTVGIVNVRSGQGAARTRGATRDIFAAIRHARSTALVTMQPAVVTYSCVMIEKDENGNDLLEPFPVAKVEIHSAKIMDSQGAAKSLQTLSGAPVPGVEEPENARPSQKTPGDDGESVQSQGGETLEEVLFAPISTEIVKGMRLKVVLNEDETDSGSDSTAKPKISVFSNVDYLIGKFKKANKAKEDAAEQLKELASTLSTTADDLQEEVSVVWETNGRTDPHTVWIYPDGLTPEKGLLVKVDRFGGMKVLSGDGSGEDDE